MPYQRILLLNRIHIGDCIFTTPAIRALREAYPEAWIVAAVPHANADLLRFNPCIDALIWRPVQNWWRKWEFIRDVRRQRFDLIVSFQEKSVFYGLTAWYARAGQTLSLEHWRTRRFYRQTVPWPHHLHRVDRYLTLASALDVPIASRHTELHVGEAYRDRAEQLLREYGLTGGKRLVGLNPGSTEAERRWPPERFAAVGDRLAGEAGAGVLLFGSKADRAMTAEIAALMTAPAVNLAGETLLMETAALMERLDVFVSGDTGPLHMAAALGTSVVAMFGPSRPELAAPCFGATGGRARILRNEESCGVCDGPCLHTITADDCADAALDLLATGRSRDGAMGRNSGTGPLAPSPQARSVESPRRPVAEVR
jgi:lipopolysaccharide heptosyltransferase II